MKRLRLLNLILSVLILWSCTDDWNFSTDSRYTLVFSADTVSMDTVFSGVASSSAKFMIYNSNDVGLRFDAVMGGGAGSPFRMNVDGEGGTSVLGLEIPAGDSLFCYISVNIPESQSTELFNAFDSIRFILENGNVQFVRLSAHGQNAVRLRGLKIVSDTVLSARLPYIIFDSLSVANNATLTLSPGISLYFHSGAVLDVAGKLIAQGTPDSMILMRGDRLDKMLTTPPVSYDLLAAQWGGIRFRSGSYDNVLSYCDIHGGSFGIKADSASADKVKFNMNSCIVHNVEGNGIEVTGCSIDVVNSQITNAGSSCLDIAGGKSDFTFCTIADLSLWSVGKQAVVIRDSRDNVNVPFAGAQFRNCIITGRHANEVVVELQDSIKQTDRYSFDYSLVLTSDSLDFHYHYVKFDHLKTPGGGSANFINKSIDGFKSVFRLDSLSRARGIADSLSQVWPMDLAGVERPLKGADAGCYQYVPIPK